MSAPYEGERVIQTYVWHGDKAFFVSTINRKCSAPVAFDHLYAETLVYEWDQETRKAGALVGQGECYAGNIRTHQSIVQELRDSGAIA